MADTNFERLKNATVDEFADGYRCCVAGMSRQELRAEENKHGKLLRKVEA